ncbi:MAG: hypothetical protein ACTHLU_09550 [Novosphingobium sp.]
MLRDLLPILLSASCIAPAAAADRGAKEMVIEPSEKQLKMVAALTPETVANGAKITDDSLETTATITTFDAYRSNGGFTDPVRSDNFLRAFVDKRTGSVRYQVYQNITYNWDWRHFTYVNYASGTGVEEEELTNIARDVVACAPGICTYREVVGFSVGEEELRKIAGQYLPGRAAFWRFRFKARNGIDWEDRVSAAEVSGLLIAVDRFRAARGWTEKQ